MTHLVGLSGSLRAGSFNTAVLRTIGERLPDGAALKLFDLAPVPMYNADLDGDATPQSVVELKQAIAEADGLILASPEYNYSVPAVLKNAVDWASRPAFKSVLKGKPVGLVSASVSATGGARAQQHWKSILSGVLADAIVMPEVLIGTAQHKVEDGRVTDETTLGFLDRFIETVLAEITRRSAGK